MLISEKMPESLLVLFELAFDPTYRKICSFSMFFLQNLTPGLGGQILNAKFFVIHLYYISVYIYNFK